MASATQADRRKIAAWLFFCCGLVALMVMVGGITRLTHSGLSIVEWQPVAGVLPPMGDAQWNDLFAKYQATPQYKQMNPDMTVDGFKQIFWWEYIHRLMGRVIGVVFFVPLLWFAARHKLEEGLSLPLFCIFVLGGLQGAFGWFMVQSGLVEQPRVSSLRLAAHLGLAFAIFGWLLWLALGQVRRERYNNTDAIRGRSGAMVALVFLQVLAGALVAGIQGGLAYNSWPLMDGHFVPPDIAELEPWWTNLAYNMAAVQFAHRILALAVLLMAVGLLFDVRRDLPNPRARFWSMILLGMALIQVALGIVTLLTRVPINLGVLHQAGALATFAAALTLRHSLREVKQFQM